MADPIIDKIKKKVDGEEVVVYPITSTNAVFNAEGVDIESLVANVEKAVYAGSAGGAVDPVPIKAEQDGDGKVISATYATKTELATAVSSIDGKVNKTGDTMTGSLNISSAANNKTLSLSNEEIVLAEGETTKIKIGNSIEFSSTSSVSGVNNYVEGTNNIVPGNYSHVEGSSNTIYGSLNHSEGTNNTVVDSENTQLFCSGNHLEGDNNTVEMTDQFTTSNGNHVEGKDNAVKGQYNHAGGIGNIVTGEGQTVIGKYNSNNSENLFEIGNGSSDSNRSNAFEVSSSGAVTAEGGFIGDLTGTASNATYDGNGNNIANSITRNSNNYVDVTDTSTQITLPSSILTTVLSLTVPTGGVWLITGYALINESGTSYTTGDRRFLFSVSETDVPANRVQISASPTGITGQKISQIFNCNAGTTIYLRLQQNSGESLSATYKSVRAVKLLN